SAVSPKRWFEKKRKSGKNAVPGDNGGLTVNPLTGDDTTFAPLFLQNVGLRRNVNLAKMPFLATTAG
ncbi:hypothetical protein V5H37_23440, partial [Salmonella enterica]|uniref:hypothetical protein n=1 Tax=Salmonella enterica TaxID=28901 RepID=UPI002FCD9156